MMTTVQKPILALSVLAAAIALPLSVTEAGAAGAGSNAKVKPVIPPQEVRVLDENGNPVPGPKPTTEVEKYCLNIADRAQDKRYALQQAKLKDLEGKIVTQINELEKRQADYKTWLAERKKFLDSASVIVVNIYSKMSAEAAAGQLAKLDRDEAASILVKLKPRQASSILSEMDVSTAAEIAGRIVKKTAAGGDSGSSGKEKQT
ncbi:MotE family protein [Jiella sp. MQZ9-1]|uniref:MotE family protein n=1 Tax=Jiella flava TaxID=2816857 RepID=A0A939FUB9_9HYPH|nr:MotE family protein [Jiella flava]MBO0660946.1 MotE family protein [Jiella flava]MCD2469594.1 MotE family protein [Jiella flava]